MLLHLPFSPGSEVTLITHFTDREAMGSFLAQGHALSKWHQAAGTCMGNTGRIWVYNIASLHVPLL